MADRNKVIDGLEKVWDAFNYMEHELYADYVFDALALLKEQEPVRPEYDPVRKRHLCPMCKAELDSYVGGYCYSCGRGLDWDGA